MRINHQVVVFDAADLAAESSFWAGVLDGTVDAEDDWHMVIVDGEPRVGVQLAPNHVPPDWPDGTPPQQIHLDLWVEDFGAAHDRVISLGAKVLKAAEEVDSVDNFQVYADPAGHPFCLCWFNDTSGGSLNRPGMTGRNLERAAARYPRDMWACAARRCSHRGVRLKPQPSSSA